MRSKLCTLLLLSALLFSGSALARNTKNDQPATPHDVTRLQQTIKSYFSQFPEVAKIVGTIQNAVAQGQCTKIDGSGIDSVVDMRIFCALSPQRDLNIRIRQTGIPKGKPSPAERYEVRGNMMEYAVSFPDSGTHQNDTWVVFKFYAGPPENP